MNYARPPQRPRGIADELAELAARDDDEDEHRAAMDREDRLNDYTPADDLPAHLRPQFPPAA